MKKTSIIALIAVVVLSVLMITACSKSEFGVTENTGKLMIISAENADKDSTFMTGSLDVEDGEQIEVRSDLSEGSVKVEIIRAPEDQSAEEVPEMDAEPVMTGNLTSTDSMRGTVEAGSYMLRATCLEKATGTVEAAVTPAQ